MSILKHSIGALVALTLATTAFAEDLDIFIAGSNGDRTATNTAIPKLLGNNVSFSGTNADPTKANFGVFRGQYAGKSAAVYVSYIGATGGIRAVAGAQPIKFVPSTSTGTVTDPTGNGNPSQSQVPDFTMSTNFQSSSPYNGTYQGVGYVPLRDQQIGVTGLKWLGSKGFPGDSVTAQQIEALYQAGNLPLAFFTGNSADQTKVVYAIGRNTDAGQRYVALAEPKVGGSNVTAISAVVKHWRPTISGAAAGMGGFVTGGTVTAQALWPIETVSGVDSQFEGNSGYATGATLAPALTATLSQAAYQVASNTATGGYYIGYLTPGDADSIAIPNGAVELKYNGSTYSADAVREGRYTSWVYSHLLYPTTFTGTKKDFADALASQITTTDAVAGGGILFGTMQVQRFSEGGTVTPKY